MKRGGIIVIAIIGVALVCGAYFWIMRSSQTSRENEDDMTKVEKVITKNLESSYPPTPREVIKVYHQIVDCYYNEKYTDKELKQMAEQALKLFDPDLQENNPIDVYILKIQTEVGEYKDRSRTISQFKVCDSNDVRMVTDTENGDELAYVDASYFIIERGGTCERTYQEYVLRKDEDGKWRILVFYQIEGNNEED